jgi:hypothetical protein
MFLVLKVVQVMQWLLTHPLTGSDVPVNDRVQREDQEFMVHIYGGKIHRVPKDWRFPRCGILDFWRQWWVGDKMRNIPPLRRIRFSDVEHIDLRPLSNFELTRNAGPNKQN